MEGIDIGIDELWQLILATVLFLLIGGTILWVADPDHIRAKAAATEVSYITTLATNNDMKIEFSYKEAKVSEANHQVHVQYDKINYPKSYFGKQVKIEPTAQGTFIINANQNG